MRIGVELLGEVDRIPGLGAIKTEFLTILYVPLFPGDSHFLLDDTSEEDIASIPGVAFLSTKSFRSIRVPLNPWSVVKGYLQRGSILFALGWICKLLFSAEPLHSLDYVIAIGAAAVMVSTHHVRPAGEERKKELMGLFCELAEQQQAYEQLPREKQREGSASFADRVLEIEAALRSGDPTERAWAIDEINALPAETACTIRRKFTLDRQTKRPAGPGPA